MTRGKKLQNKKPRSVGAYGSKRGTPDKQVARRRNRESQGRVRESMEEVREAQAQLERRMKREADDPALGATVGAALAAERAELEAQAERLAAVQPEPVDSPYSTRKYLGRYQPYDGDPVAPWTIGQARTMLRAGYTVQHVMKTTKIGWKWLDDIRVGDDHRARPE